MRKCYDEKKQAVRISAYYKDFDGDIEKWKDAFYQLWRWQMTWDFAYSIEVIDTREGVKVYVSAKPAYKQNILDTMESLGYREVNVWDENIAIIYQYDHEELEDIDGIAFE